MRQVVVVSLSSSRKYFRNFPYGEKLHVRWDYGFPFVRLSAGTLPRNWFAIPEFGAR